MTSQRTDPSAAVEQLRSRIGEVDRELVELLAERVRLAREIGDLKRNGERATLDPAREAAVIRTATQAGREAGLDPEDTRELLWTVIGICRRAQLSG
ncbi:MAG TPA: chorismate mutase [Longimicrobiales bacterium]|nr:chorismate mutase [Longimicrobiales bacterium]